MADYREDPFQRLSSVGWPASTVILVSMFQDVIAPDPTGPESPFPGYYYAGTSTRLWDDLVTQGFGGVVSQFNVNILRFSKSTGSPSFTSVPFFDAEDWRLPLHPSADTSPAFTLTGQTSSTVFSHPALASALEFNDPGPPNNIYRPFADTGDDETIDEIFTGDPYTLPRMLFYGANASRDVYIIDYYVPVDPGTALSTTFPGWVSLEECTLTT